MVGELCMPWDVSDEPLPKETGEETFVLYVGSWFMPRGQQNERK